MTFFLYSWKRISERWSLCMLALGYLALNVLLLGTLFLRQR
jgi:hypothetical protein